MFFALKVTVTPGSEAPTLSVASPDTFVRRAGWDAIGPTEELTS
jgi:hypothetical protein